MKKFITVLLCIIIILSPVKIVRSAEAIELTNESLQLLNNGVDFLSYSGSVPYGFLPFVFSSEKNYQSVLEDKMQKEDVFIIDGNANINIRPLNQSEYGLLENAYVYDDNGDVVSLSDLYFGTVDNGYFTEKFYCKNDGSIVYQDSSKDNPYIDVKFGGSDYSYLQWQNTYDSLADDLDTTNFNYSLTDNINLTNENVSLYYMCAYKYRGTVYGLVSVFVPNCYDKGTAITNGSFTTYYNGSNKYYTVLQGSLSGAGMEAFGGGTVDNVSYSNAFYVPSYWWNGGATFCTLDQWYNNSYERAIINYNGWTYNSNLANADIVSYKKVIDNADTLDLSKSYTISSLNDYADIISSISSTPNASFDNTQAITAINYPLVNEIDNSISDVVIPFPESAVIDDTPAIDYPLDDTIDATLITDNIPIISDLQNKFPFSIPWDIANILKGLESERTTPYINTDVTIPGVNYTWHIEYDLSDFDSTAELFRTLFLIAFILGLAYFSYDHFFGS